MSDLRPELPPDIPERMAVLHVHRGYPVPWFVAWVDDEQKELPRGEGTPDFRILESNAGRDAVMFDLCWICGQRLGSFKAFVAGPMCGVNRTSAEPPSHVACADWSARACPFLARPHAVRREAGMPEDYQEMPGIALKRNPGVTMVWVTRKYGFKHGGQLCDIGEPVEIRWYREGRVATRAEIVESIESGLPALQELADEEGGFAPKALARQVNDFMSKLPSDDNVA